MMLQRSLTSQKGNIALILLITLLVLAGVVFFLISKGIIKNPLQKSPTNANLGGQIFEKTQNPLQGKMPEVDAFQAETNPFKDIYPNPFDRTSK